MLLTSLLIMGGMVAGVKAYKEYKNEKKINSIFSIVKKSSPRQQQLLEISGDKEAPSEIKKEVNRYLVISTATLVLAAGRLSYPILNVPTFLALLYLITPILKRAFHSVFKERKITIAIIDVIGTIGPIVIGYFFTSALACWLTYGVGRKLLVETEDHSRKSIINVFSKQPRFIWIFSEGLEVQIPFDTVQIGDIVIVHAGETIPIDGIIINGQAHIDQRILTGESQAVEKGIGDQVLASTIVLEGKIEVRVQKAGKDTTAAKIGEILNRTADFKFSIQSRSEKIVDQGVAPTLAIGALTLPILGAQSALATMYAGFGYQMRIAGPISVLNFLRIASEKGILIKDGRSVELLSEVDTFVFDKTGTLTEEVPIVGTIHTCNGHSKEELLTYAAAAEYKQTHPIARAIQKETSIRELMLPPIHKAKYEVGYGLKVHIEESSSSAGHPCPVKKLIRVGSSRFLEMEGITIPNEIKKIQEACYSEGYSIVFIAIDNLLGGAIELRPTIRPEAKQIISELRKHQIEIYIISGDHEKPTKKLAQELGIEHYFAETLPQNKASLIEQLQNEGKSVCFVGDGINDSIALKNANVSVSLRGASTVAIDSASIVLMDESLNQLIPLLDIAQDLDSNLKISTIMTVLPGIICVGGVFFLHLGLTSAIIWYNVSLLASVSNALLPLKTHQSKKQVCE
jgi:heavy metal translocating P-type ATPase